MGYDQDKFIENLEETLEHKEREGKIASYDVRELTGNSVVVVEHMDDFDPDLSHLGQWRDDLSDFMVDRKTGRFYGQYIYRDYQVTLPAELRGEDGDDDVDAAQEEWALAATKADAFKTDKLDFDDEHTEVSVSMDGDSIIVSVGGYEVLADDLGYGWDRNTYRYFEPPFGLELEKADGDRAEYVKYSVQDYERIESYNRQNWGMLGVRVTLYVNGENICDGDLWGIESDSEDSYFREVEHDLLTDIVADLQDHIDAAHRLLDNKVWALENVDVKAVKAAAEKEGKNA